MKKYVSLDKRSKKAQKEYYSERRVTWGELNLVTRSVPSGKNYNRKKDKQEMRRADLRSGDGFEASFFYEKEHLGFENKILIWYNDYMAKGVNPIRALMGDKGK